MGVLSVLVASLTVLAGSSSDSGMTYSPGYLVIGLVVGGGVGALIGSTKGRTGLGAILGALLGCIGWIIVLVLPKKDPY